ncbi:MAG: Ldh family oxidoreductase, partial [Thermoplasmata archaeon]|nr:Ldh family oxidoreductase [Thermoplasmata archaeon]
MAGEKKRVNHEALKDFVAKVFQKLNVPEQDAKTTAEILVASDLRGIPSHGVARLQRYVNGIENGIMNPTPTITTVHETPISATIDGGDGLGQVVGFKAMKMAIEKAKKNGVGFVAVRGSNHYGIAGYYSMMALEHDLIGISMTNSAPLVVPTFGIDLMLGTSPISLAAPAGKERSFVFDGATACVPRGKLEVYNRQGKEIPLGWAVDETGKPSTDAARILKNMTEKKGGGCVPLGGEGELFGGHKGYGFGLIVDVLSAILSGGLWSYRSYPKKEGKALPAKVAHFFAAIRIDYFIPQEEFKGGMDEMIKDLKDSGKAENQNRIYVHGEKSFEATEENTKLGVPLEEKVANQL